MNPSNRPSVGAVEAARDIFRTLYPSLCVGDDHPKIVKWAEIVESSTQVSELRRVLKKAAHQIGTTDEELVAEIWAVLEGKG